LRYVFQPGDGADVIEDLGSNDSDVLRLDGFNLAEAHFARVFGDADSLLITLGSDQVTVIDGLSSSTANEIESYQFDDATLNGDEIRAALMADAGGPGPQTIIGFDAADTLEGGQGDDVLSGLGGSDLYRFAKGDGADVIEDGALFSTDRLEISGYALSEAAFTRAPWNPANLLISFPGFADSIDIRNGIAGNTGIIEEIHFVDEDVTLSNADIRARIIERLETGLGDVITGFDGADTIDAGPSLAEIPFGSRAIPLLKPRLT